MSKPTGGDQRALRAKSSSALARSCRSSPQAPADPLPAGEIVGDWLVAGERPRPQAPGKPICEITLNGRCLRLLRGAESFDVENAAVLVGKNGPRIFRGGLPAGGLMPLRPGGSCHDCGG